MVTGPASFSLWPGSPACLVSRPQGVSHIYIGPLTPSGRLVPRGARTACRARTRRLYLVEPSARVRRLCARCSARLAASHPPSARRADLTTRDDWATAYAGVTAFQLAVDAWRATTLPEVERLEHLALLVVGFPACRDTPVVSPDGKQTQPLDEFISRARTRIGADHGQELAARADDMTAAAQQKRRGERRGVWQEREARIERLGFTNATSDEPRRRRKARV